jgi:hypothetical protein
MLYTDEVLFIHPPKTAGMAVTEYLLANLPGTKTLSVPNGHASPRADVIVVSGRRHENLPEAAERLRELGRSMDSFRIILAVIRNPYALEVSRFHYYQLGHPWDAGLLQDLAMTGDFDAFVKGATYPYIRAPRPIETFYTLDGVMPRQLRLLRAEHLAEDLATALGRPRVPLQSVNATQHGHWSDYLTADNEALIHEKYRWLFQFYPRYTGPLASAAASHAVAAH